LLSGGATAPADPGTPMESSWSVKKREIREEGMKTEPSPVNESVGRKGRNTNAKKFVNIKLHHNKELQAASIFLRE
jgi:hypothetical protein